MDERILFVDDDPNILEAYQRKLQHVLRVHTAQGPHVGLREIQEKGPFAVVVADMNMPLMNGVEFLKRVREISPNTVRMMLTGNVDIKVAMEAVNEGSIFRFLMKPCPPKLFGESLAAAIEQYRLITAEKDLLEGTLSGMVELLTEVLSWANPEAFGRSLQLRNTVRLVGEKLKAENLWEIEMATTLCQIGLLAIPTEVLSKVSRNDLLTPEESRILESVPATGHELLARIPRLERVADIILFQNKRFDGVGFPESAISGEAIPLGSRILKAVMEYHQLRSAGLSRHDCLRELWARKGWYDPTVLEALGIIRPSAMAVSERPSSIWISMQSLRAGYILASPIMTAGGLILVGAGTILSEALLVRLRNYHETNNVREPIEVYQRSMEATEEAGAMDDENV